MSYFKEEKKLMNVMDNFNMNKFLNFVFIFSIPCYIWDLYDIIILGDRSILIFISLICLTIFFAIEIPKRLIMLLLFGTFWY
jgi:hypothetical protein